MTRAAKSRVTLRENEIMRHRLLLILLIVTGLGCGPVYSPLAAHSIKVSEHVEQDVVWVLRNGEAVVRCSNAEKVPVCVKAQPR
jgi:hypothetical protein